MAQTGYSKHVVYGEGRIGGETVLVPKGQTEMDDAFHGKWKKTMDMS